MLRFRERVCKVILAEEGRVSKRGVVDVVVLSVLVLKRSIEEIF